MLLLREQDFTASGHDTLDANSLVMVTLRQATSLYAFYRKQMEMFPCHQLGGISKCGQSAPIPTNMAGERVSIGRTDSDRG